MTQAQSQQSKTSQGFRCKPMAVDAADRAAVLLERLCRQHAATVYGDYLFLPSVMTLGRTLKCSAADVQAAMDKLSGQGYGFLVLDLESPVTVCVARKTG